MSSHGKYNERDPYSMAQSPQNKQESEQYANALSDSGYYPKGLGGCFTVGISGGCGTECWVYQEGKCGIADEVLERALEGVSDNA